MKKDNKLRVEVSARHIHLCKSDFESLFGKTELTVKRNLSQPGQFVSDVKLALVNDDKVIDNVSVLGPFRDISQIEISLTDAVFLKLDVPIKDSGDLKGSSGIVLKGPKGVLKLSKGVIVSRRHIHISPVEAKKFGVIDKQVVSVLVEGVRSVVFNNVLVRVNSEFSCSFHIDTDEANSAGIKSESVGFLIKD